MVSCIVLHIQNENVERKHCFLYCLTLYSSGGPLGAASRQVQSIFFLMRDAAGFGASICAIGDQTNQVGNKTENDFRKGRYSLGTDSTVFKVRTTTFYACD